MTKRNGLITGIAVVITALGVCLAPGVDDANKANKGFTCEVKTMAEYGFEGENEFVCAGVGDYTDFVIVSAESGTDVHKGEIITLDTTSIDEDGTIQMGTK